MTVLSSKRKVANKAINPLIDLSVPVDALVFWRSYAKKLAATYSSNAAIYDKEIRRRRKLARVAP